MPDPNTPYLSYTSEIIKTKKGLWIKFNTPIEPNFTPLLTVLLTPKEVAQQYIEMKGGRETFQTLKDDMRLQEKAIFFERFCQKKVIELFKQEKEENSSTDLKLGQYSDSIRLVNLMRRKLIEEHGLIPCMAMLVTWAFLTKMIMDDLELFKAHLWMIVHEQDQEILNLTCKNALIEIFIHNKNARA